MHTKRDWGFASAIFASAIAGVIWTAGAFAAALVADLEGDVRVEVAGAQSRAIVPGQRLDSGSLVTTARGARVMLRFDDGQWAALHEDTHFRIEDFRYRPGEPAADRAVFVLLRGALRIVTGALGRRNPEAFGLRTSNLMIGVRGTDFMVATANPTYLSVLEGRIAATNAGGSVTFDVGDLGAAADGKTLAAAVQGDALPATVASAFGRLSALRMAAPAPRSALARPPELASVGRNAAARARQMKDEIGRNTGKDTSDAVREHGRNNALKPHPK